MTDTTSKKIYGTRFPQHKTQKYVQRTHISMFTQIRNWSIKLPSNEH